MIDYHALARDYAIAIRKMRDEAPERRARLVAAGATESRLRAFDMCQQGTGLIEWWDREAADFMRKADERK